MIEEEGFPKFIQVQLPMLLLAILASINLWIAIGPVREDNGMILYPDTWGYNIPREGKFIRRSQRLGKPLRFECDPGDIVVFHSRLMHSSVLNQSDQTRFVITSRLVLETPVPFTAEELDKVYYFSPFIGIGVLEVKIGFQGIFPDLGIEAQAGENQKDEEEGLPAKGKR